MLNQIKKYQQYSIFKQFQDIRAIGLIVFGLIVLLVTWSGVGAVETNFDLQKQASQLKQQNQLAELENNNLQLQNQYYNTNEYLELQARELFGKGLPGEKLILVPQSVALADTVNLSSSVHSTSKLPPKPTYQRNFEAWIDFFFHRTST